MYANPAFLANEVGGSSQLDSKTLNILRARSLLYGADPSQCGSSSFEMTHSESGRKHLHALAKMTLEDTPKLSEQGISIRPTKEVKILLEKAKSEKIEELTKQIQSLKLLSF